MLARSNMPLRPQPPAAAGLPHRNDRVTAVVLSAIAGYVDTAGFLALFGLFTAHVTGNLVTAGAALARRAPEGVSARLAMIPIFMLSVAAAALVARALRRRGKEPLVPLLGLMTVALVAFWAAGTTLASFAGGPDSWAVLLISGTAVVTMGIQNALMRESLRHLASTTGMTTNLTQFTLDLVEFVRPAGLDAESRAKGCAEAKQGLIMLGLPLGAFIVGAALGAWLTGAFGLKSIALPALVAGALTLAVSRRMLQ
jgi:uncharacterized membrane protein YoaK (UPF0700 family)